MKKLFFTALLFAGTTLGFAKDNIQNTKSINIQSSKLERNIEKKQRIYHFDSLEKAEKFLAECTDLVVVTTEEEEETVILSIHESTHPCKDESEGGVTVFVISI